MKIKRKFMAGFLALLLLSSQLVLPCSALANNSQPTNQPITKSKDEPKKNTKEKSDNNPFKIEPLKELKSQDRSSSPEKKYKHVKMNGLPKEVQMRVDRSSLELASTGDPVNALITLTGLKPNSKCSFSVKINEHDPIAMQAIADEIGQAKTNFTYTLTKSDSDGHIGKFVCFIVFFEGDVIDNSPVEKTANNDPKVEFNFGDTQDIDPRDDIKFTIKITKLKLNNVTDNTVKLKIKFTTNGNIVDEIKEYTIHPDKNGEATINGTYQSPKHFVKSLTITYGFGKNDPIKPVILANSKFFSFIAHENTYGPPPMTMDPEFLNNGLYNFCVAAYLDGNRLDGVPIEILDNKNNIIASAKTKNGFGEAAFNIPLTLGTHDLKVRMNKEFLSSYEKEEHKNIYWDKEKNITLTVEMCPLDDGRKEPAVTRIDMYGEDDDFDNSNSLLAFRNFTKTIKPEQKEYTITVQSVATREGQPDRSLYDIPIEIYRNDRTLIASGKTSDDGTFKAKIKAFSGEKIKIKQIIDEASRNLDVELDPNEKIISMSVSTADSVVIFSNKDKLDTSDCYVKFNFQFPPNANVSFDACKFNFAYNVPDQLDTNFIYTSPHNFTVLLINDSRTPIKRSQATNFAIVNTPKFPPGYYVESINGMDPNTTFEKVPKEVTIKIGYKATGEFKYSAKIKIPNEKYKGCFEAGLLDEQGHVVVSAVNDEKGKFHFDKIKYTEKDVGEHVYRRYIKYTDKGLKLKGTLGEIKLFEKELLPIGILVKDKGDGTLEIPMDGTTSMYHNPYLAPLLPVTGTIKTILAVGVLVLGTTTAIIIKRRKTIKNNHKNGN